MAEKCRNRELTEILWRLVLFMKYCGKRKNSGQCVVVWG